MGNWGANENEELGKEIASDEAARQAESEKLAAMDPEKRKKYVELKAKIEEQEAEGNMNYANDLREHLKKLES